MNTQFSNLSSSEAPPPLALVYHPPAHRQRLLPPSALPPRQTRPPPAQRSVFPSPGPGDASRRGGGGGGRGGRGGVSGPPDAGLREAPQVEGRRGRPGVRMGRRERGCPRGGRFRAPGQRARGRAGAGPGRGDAGCEARSTGRVPGAAQTAQRAPAGCPQFPHLCPAAHSRKPPRRREKRCASPRDDDARRPDGR